MKIHYIRLSCRLLILLLAITGFTACDDEPENEYKYDDTVNATHIIKAKVTDKNEEPIPGIKVVVTSNYHRIDSAFTNKNGLTTITISDFPGNSYILENSDIDGEENGSYTTVFTEVSFEGVRYNDAGSAQKEVEIVMENTDAEN